MSMGRKTKLTKVMIDNAEKLVSAGNYDTTVIEFLGISHNSWYLWLKEGKEDLDNGRNTIKAEFYTRVKKAGATAEIRAVSGILSAGTDSWQALAWFLERKYFNKWGKKERTEITGKDGESISINAKEMLIQKLTAIVDDKEENE